MKNKILRLLGFLCLLQDRPGVANFFNDIPNNSEFWKGRGCLHLLGTLVQLDRLNWTAIFLSYQSCSLIF